MQILAVIGAAGVLLLIAVGAAYLIQNVSIKKD